MSSSQWLEIFAWAGATLFLQVSVQLGVGHAFKAREKQVPLESFWLISLYALTPLLGALIHGNFHLTLLSISLGLAYVLGFNPASGIRSPSFRILGLLIYRQKLSKEEIASELSQDQIFQRKLQDLITDGWVYREGSRIVLSSAARAMVLLFRGYRALLNLREGTG